MDKQVTRSLFLAKYLLRNKPQDPAVEKLLTRMRDKKEENDSSTESAS